MNINNFQKKSVIVVILFTLVALPVILFAFQYSTENRSKAAGGPTNSLQYILVRKSGGCGTIAGGAGDCSYIWNGMAPNRYNQAAINEIINAIGTKGSQYRKLGIGTIFTYLNYPRDEAIPKMKQSLQNLLANTLQADIPVFIALDGAQWWNGRPELWNWWDPNKPGYNPDNKNNVEWTGWDNSHAIKKAWRNWGREMEVGSPPPNISSEAFVNACTDALNELLPVIITWYNALPQDKKYLLVGVSLAVEMDIGINYYYYPGGVQPTEPAKQGYDFGVQLGYAALKTAGIKSSGTITDDDLTKAVNRYLNTLYDYAYEKGMPKEKLFVHSGFKDRANLKNKYSKAESALVDHAQAGWSLYNDNAREPSRVTYLTGSINAIGNAQWSSPEWGIDPNFSQKEYATALRNTLRFKKNLFVNIANWEGILNKPNVLAAIKEVLLEKPNNVLLRPSPSTPQPTMSHIKTTIEPTPIAPPRSRFGTISTPKTNKNILDREFRVREKPQ